MYSPRPYPKDRRSGFALLITITLLAFLVLLLVSLAALTRVETQVASNNQQLSQARQNALMALNVALGKLQAAAGPDQRITATADIVSNVHNDKRRWTGVWNTTAATPTPEWLVSTAAATPATGTVAVTTALPNTGTVELVGINTTDTTVAGNAVTVETQPITSTSVPGMSGQQTVGHFAYWVGDEGVKAKVSLTDPWAATTVPEEKSFQLKGAQRTGIELVDSEDDTALDTNYPVNDGNLAKVLDVKQLSLTSTAGSPALSIATKNRYHDLTASSWSVLADVSQGGLKKDLTSWLAQSSPATGAPADDDLIFAKHADDTTGFGLPQWGIIRSYAELQGGASNPLGAQPQTASRQGFHPVVTFARIGFSAHAGEPDAVTNQSKMVAQIFPIVVLWNPYNTPIAPTTYEFVFGARANNAYVRFVSASGGTANSRYLNLASFSPVLATSAPSFISGAENWRRKFMRFALESPQMKPGESLVFTLQSSGEYIAPGTTAAIGGNAPIPLVPNNPAATDNSVFVSSANAYITAADRAAGKKITLQVHNNPWLQWGLYPQQPADSDPTVADMIAQDPYMLTGWFRTASHGAVTLDTLTAPQMPTAPIRYGYVRMQMSRYTTSYWNGNASFINIRWLAQTNPRAPYHLYVYPGTGPGGPLTMGGDFVNNTAVPNDRYDGNQASAGPWMISDGTATNPTVNLQIAELIPPSTKPGSRLFSLAQLQHANFALLAQTVGSAVGNSQVPFIVGRTDRPGIVASPESSAGLPEQVPASNVRWYNDISYRMNQTLWDRYFFSTIPDTLTDAPAGAPGANPSVNDPSYHLPNARNTFLRKEGATLTAAALAGPEAFNTAAEHLLVNGAFNVNSTSEQAWRALLASHNNVDTAPGGFTHPYSRFSSTEPRTSDPSAPQANTSWSSGYRILSDDQITSLAERIVVEVKARGPFLSLADFVNRRLATDATGLKGALQAAIDATDLDADPDKRINDRFPFNDAAHAVEQGAMYPSKTTDPTAKQNFLADADAEPNRPSASRAAFAPGFLTQADLLNSLGPVLTARSDTFVIRAYGDVQNPATTTIEGKAWCEAVVQRLPDYMEDADAATVAPSVANATNQTFGRRFKIVSFRWLSSTDI